MGPTLSIMSNQLLYYYAFNMNLIWSAHKVVMYINFYCSKSNRNRSTFKDVIYIILPRNTKNFAYETSFLKHGKLIIDGDVESNPGPITSIESYCAAIGRHDGKFRSKGKINTQNGKHLALCLWKIILLSHYFIPCLLD